MDRKLVLIAILTLGKAISLEIYSDNPKNGLIFEKNQQIHTREFYKYLFYTFDVSTVQYILSWKEDIKTKCNNTHNIYFDTANINWNHYLPGPDISDENIRRIKMNLRYNDLINVNMDRLNGEFNSTFECNSLARTAYNFNKMNSELNKLSDLNISSLEEVISLSDIAIEMSIMLKQYNNEFNLPFSMTYNFERDLFKYVEFDFYQINNEVTLSFKVPFDKKVMLFNAFKKPLV